MSHRSDLGLIGVRHTVEVEVEVRSLVDYPIDGHLQDHLLLAKLSHVGECNIEVALQIIEPPFGESLRSLGVHAGILHLLWTD